MAEEFCLRAVAGKGEFKISLLSVNPLILKACIPDCPIKGKANRRLISELESRLKCKVCILAGHKSKRKILSAQCTKDSLLHLAGHK